MLSHLKEQQYLGFRTKLTLITLRLWFSLSILIKPPRAQIFVAREAAYFSYFHAEWSLTHPRNISGKASRNLQLEHFLALTLSKKSNFRSSQFLREVGASIA